MSNNDRAAGYQFLQEYTVLWVTKKVRGEVSKGLPEEMALGFNLEA